MIILENRVGLIVETDSVRINAEWAFHMTGGHAVYYVTPVVSDASVCRLDHLQCREFYAT